jgi:hypothetical protein
MADLEPSDRHLVLEVSSVVVECRRAIRRFDPREETTEGRHIPCHGRWRLGHAPFGTRQSTATMRSCDSRCGHKDDNQGYQEPGHF